MYVCLGMCVRVCMCVHVRMCVFLGEIFATKVIVSEGKYTLLDRTIVYLNDTKFISYQYMHSDVWSWTYSLAEIRLIYNEYK